MSYQKRLRKCGFNLHRWKDKRLKEYFKRMSTDFEGVIYDDNVADALVAQGYSIKESPRSVYSVDKLYSAFENYAPSNFEVKGSKALTHGIRLAYSCFSRPRGVPYLDPLELSMKTIWKITSSPTASSGLTATGLTKSQAQDVALERSNKILKYLIDPAPCLSFKRTQFEGKTRYVWGYPYEMTVVEGMVAYPLIQKFKGGTTPMSFATTSMALGTKLRVASYNKRWAYSLDFSQYDATVPASLIRTAFDILRTWFRSGEIISGTEITTRQLFNIIEEYFINTYAVLPCGYVVYGKNRGVPSGSYFTQLIDSIVNVIIAGAISWDFHLNIDKRELFVLGDDILFWSDQKVDLERISQFVSEQFDMNLHGSEKSAIYRYDEPIHFLGRIWTNGLPDLDEEGIIARMVYPERFRRYSKDYEERAREVHLLILSFATQYRSAWTIAERTLEYANRNVNRGVSPTLFDVYYKHRNSCDPDYLSGLTRFKMKYVYEQPKSEAPDLVLQYWM